MKKKTTFTKKQIETNVEFVIEHYESLVYTINMKIPLIEISIKELRFFEFAKRQRYLMILHNQKDLKEIFQNAIKLLKYCI